MVLRWSELRGAPMNHERVVSAIVVRLGLNGTVFFMLFLSLVLMRQSISANRFSQNRTTYTRDLWLCLFRLLLLLREHALCK